MAKKSLILKSQRTPKFGVRRYSRCMSCGRPRSVYRRVRLCRICLRGMALKGLIPGMVKASW